MQHHGEKTADLLGAWIMGDEAGKDRTEGLYVQNNKVWDSLTSLTRLKKLLSSGWATVDVEVEPGRE